MEKQKEEHELWTIDRFVKTIQPSISRTDQLKPWKTTSALHPNDVLSRWQQNYFVVIFSTGSQNTRVDVTPFPSILLQPYLSVSKKTSKRRLYAINGPFTSESNATIFKRLLNAYPRTSRGASSKRDRANWMNTHRFGTFLWCDP